MSRRSEDDERSKERGVAVEDPPRENGQPGHTERALRRSEARYRTLVESSPYCIHEIDRDGTLMSMNRAGVCMMGVECEADVVGMPYLDAVCESDRPRIEQLMHAAFDGRMSEFEFEAINGAFFASSFVPIVDDRGRIVRLMGLTQDVTDQTRGKRELLAMQHRLELALRGNELRLWERDLVTERLVVTRLDDETDRLVHEDWARGERFLEIHPDDRAQFEACVEAHLGGRTPSIDSEHRVCDDDGSYRWVLVQGRVVERDAGGRPQRVAGTLLDINDHHEAEQRRRRLEARLQHAQKLESVGELAGGIAHDFNNLLQVVIGHLSLAQAKVDPRGELGEYLEEAQVASERASQLTRQLLSFSRQESTARTVRELAPLLETFSRMITRVLPESIAFAIEADDDVPAVLIDGGQLEQVVLNLCVNARDAMPDGGRLEIRLRAAHDADLGPCAEILVVDDGTGMDADTAARAFDPFFTTKGKQAGSGMGLAMVYGIVGKHDGRVQLDSEPGRGTTVSLRFPAAEGDVTEPEVHAASAATAKRSGTVLVVEDEDAVRKLYELTLASAGFDVVTARNGVEGLARFREHRGELDLLLVDAVMPEMGGQDMCDRVLAEAPRTPILFTSGYHENAALSGDFLERHGLTVLSKPHTPKELVGAIDGVLGRRVG